MSRWPERRLGELVDVLSGFAFESDRFFDMGELPLVRIRNVVAGHSSTYYRGEFDSRYVVRDGDILVGMDGEFNRGRWRGGKALLNQRVCRISSASPELDEGYLFHFLPNALEQIERLTSFVTVKHLSVNTVREIAIPLPPISAQRRIAEILDKAEALRAKRRAALAQLDALTRAIFLDMFGDPATNPRGWPLRKVGEFIQSASYGTSEKAGTIGDFPVLRMNNITPTGEIDLTGLKYMNLREDERQRYLVQMGDVLFNRTNSQDLVGKTAIYRHSRPVAYAGYLIRLRVKSGNDPEYLAAFLNTGYSKRVLRGMCRSIIGMANINATELQKVRIPEPPSSLQNEFASRVASVERQRASLRAESAQLDALFASLQHRAFRGEL